MEIAAALLAGAAVFFLGFYLGAFPPLKPKVLRTVNTVNASGNTNFKNFLNYDGDIQP